MEQVNQNKTLTQEQIEIFNKAISVLADVCTKIANVVKEIISKITKIWNEYLFKIYKNKKIIRKINYIYIHTKNRRIKEKQIRRLYKILRE